jgi:putative inorganic carbon (HCO3(-)) transporter
VRDLILLAALLGVIPLILRTPVVGLLVWIWITLMNPQREVYGALQGFQLNMYIAALTAMAWAVSKERKVVPLNLLTMAFLLFAAWTCLTTYNAVVRPYSYPLWDRTMKSLVLAFAVMTLANSRARIQGVLWMMVLSIGYYTVKGAGFVLLTGGHNHVYGPENTMIADNNSLGLILIVLLPLMNYLRVTTRVGATRLVMLGVIVCDFLAIFGTYSRGALVALAAAGAANAVRSRSGILLVLLGAVLVAFVPAFLPSGWTERMSTIQSADKDESFNGRISAWKTSYHIAASRPLGGGFSSIDNTQVVQQFATPGGLTEGKAAHSIYFQVLGDHGFVGFALYLFVLAAAWVNTFSVLNASRARPDLAWAGQLARMIQVSLVAFLVGGAALSMAYYDGILILFALTASLLQVARKPATRDADAAAPRWRQAEAAPSPEPAAA